MSSKSNDSDLVPASTASVNLTDLSTEIAQTPDVQDVKTVAAATLSANSLNVTGTKMHQANSLMKQHAKDMRNASEQLDKQLIRRVRVLPAYIGQYAIIKIINQNDGRFLVEARPLPARLNADKKSGSQPGSSEELESEWLLLCSAPLIEDDAGGLIESGEIDTVRIKSLFAQLEWAIQFHDMSFVLPDDAGFDKGWIYISLGKKRVWDNRTPLSRQRLKHTSPRSKGIATAKMLLEICYVLSEMHDRGVAHGHIHPGRIWRNKFNGKWEITGLGLGDADAVEVFQVPNPWSFIAPEWRRDVRRTHPGGIPTPQADIYSIAAIAIWLLTDESPVTPKKSWEKTLLECFPRALATSIWQSFQAKPHRRPAGMSILIYELERFLLKADYRSTPARDTKCLELEGEATKLGDLARANTSTTISYAVLSFSVIAVALSIVDQSAPAVFLACAALFTWLIHYSLAALRRNGAYLEKIFQTLYGTLPVTGHISSVLLLVAMSNVLLMFCYIGGQLIRAQEYIPLVATAMLVSIGINIIEHSVIFRSRLKRKIETAKTLLNNIEDIITRGLPVRMAFNILAHSTRKSAQGSLENDNWEQVFEIFKGYQPKIKARQYFGFLYKDKVTVERPRYLRWRDWILGNDMPLDVAIDPKLTMQNWASTSDKQVALTESIHDWMVDESITMGDMFMIHPIHQDDPDEIPGEMNVEDASESQMEIIKTKKQAKEAQVMTLDPEETTEELNFAFDKTSPLDSKLGTKTMYFSSINEAQNPKRSKVEHIARAAKILLQSDMPGLSFPLRSNSKEADTSEDQHNQIWHFNHDDCIQNIEESAKEGRISLLFSFCLSVLLLFPTALWLGGTKNTFEILAGTDMPWLNQMFTGLTPAIAAFSLILSNCFLKIKKVLILTAGINLVLGALINPLQYGIMVASLIAIIATVTPVLMIKGDEQ